MAANTKIFIPRYISSVTYTPARVIPHIYFYNGQRQCEPWYIEGYSGSATTSSATIVTQSVDTFPQLDYYSKQVVDSSSLSLLFNNEFTPYGTIPSQSLYSEYWQNYISLLYNPHTRLIACSAIIPLADYFTLNLNDVIDWRGNYYYLRAINDYNVANGECNLQLLGPIINDTLTINYIPPVDCNFSFTAVTAGQTTTTSTTSTTTSTTSTSTSTSTTTEAPTISKNGLTIWNRCSSISGSVWKDVSGNNNNALISGSLPLTLSGSLGVEFVSSSSNPTYLTYPASLVASPSSSFTLQFFGSPKYGVGDMTLFGKSSPSASVNSDGWFTAMNGNTDTLARIYYYDKFTEEVVTPPATPQATRSLYTFIFNEGDGNNATMYLNNNLSASFTPGPFTGFNTASTTPFTFGYDANSGTPNFGSYVGTINDLIVYNRALSQSEINQNYLYLTSQSCVLPTPTSTSTTSTSTSTSTTSTSTSTSTTSTSTSTSTTSTSTSTTSTSTSTSTTTAGPTSTSTTTIYVGPSTTTSTTTAAPVSPILWYDANYTASYTSSAPSIWKNIGTLGSGSSNQYELALQTATLITNYGAACGNALSIDGGYAGFNNKVFTSSVDFTWIYCLQTKQYGITNLVDGTSSVEIANNAQYEIQNIGFTDTSPANNFSTTLSGSYNTFVVQRKSPNTIEIRSSIDNFTQAYVPTDNLGAIYNGFNYINYAVYNQLNVRSVKVFDSYLSQAQLLNNVSCPNCTTTTSTSTTSTSTTTISPCDTYKLVGGGCNGYYSYVDCDGVTQSLMTRYRFINYVCAKSTPILGAGCPATITNMGACNITSTTTSTSTTTAAPITPTSTTTTSTTTAGPPTPTSTSTTSTSTSTTTQYVGQSTTTSTSTTSTSTSTSTSTTSTSTSTSTSTTSTSTTSTTTLACQTLTYPTDFSISGPTQNISTGQSAVYTFNLNSTNPLDYPFTMSMQFAGAYITSVEPYPSTLIFWESPGVLRTGFHNTRTLQWVDPYNVDSKYGYIRIGVKNACTDTLSNPDYLYVTGSVNTTSTSTSTTTSGPTTTTSTTTIYVPPTCTQYRNDNTFDVTLVNYTTCAGIVLTNQTLYGTITGGGTGQSICAQDGTLSGDGAAYLTNVGTCT